MAVNFFEHINSTARIVAGLGLGLLFTVGCSPTDDTDSTKSAKNSKYKAADTDSTGSTAKDKEDASIASSAKEVSSGSAVPAQPSLTPPSGGSTGTAAVPPTFNAEGNTPDTRAFMVLRPVESQDPKALVKYLADADNAFRELLMAMQASRVNEQVVMERGNAIGKMKLDAAEKLAKVATEATDKDISVYAKIEALSQLAGFADAEAARTLEGYAKEVATISNPKMAHQANLVLFSFRVSEYDSGQIKTSEPLLAEMDRLLKDTKMLSIPDFRMMGQTLQVLQRQGDKAGFDAAKEKIAKAFAENEDPRLVMQAWNMKVSGSEEEAAFQESLQKSIESPDDKELLATFRKAMDGMIAKYPESPTLLFLGGLAMQIEMTGATDTAKLVVDTVKSKADTVPAGDFRTQLDRILGDASKRFDLLGKPIDLSKLTNIKGEAIDLSNLTGKVILLDVWATWCKPCIASFPELKEVYDAQKEKGFEIIGINIDEELADVQAFQAKSPLPWLVARSTDPSDPMAIGFKSPIAEKLGVTAIPMMVLLDRKGNAVAMHLRGERLSKKVSELLAN